MGKLELKSSKECTTNLLNLIPNERKLIVEGSGGKMKNYDEVDDELELRLGPPTSEYWWSISKQQEDHSYVHHTVMSIGHCSKVPKYTCTSASEVLALKHHQHQQNSGFLEMQSKGQEASQSADNLASIQKRAATTPVVGWPPIRTFRKNLASTSKTSPLGSFDNGDQETMLKNISKCGFVKINMDGIPIGRKVDLKLYDCYDKLSLAVGELFQGLLAAQGDTIATDDYKNAAKSNDITCLLDEKGEYTMVYEDDEGDRMLVGDVPWDMFVATAKRLRLVKSSELSVSTLETVSRKRTADEF